MGSRSHKLPRLPQELVTAANSITSAPASPLARLGRGAWGQGRSKIHVHLAHVKKLVGWAPPTGTASLPRVLPDGSPIGRLLYRAAARGRPFPRVYPPSNPLFEV